LTENLLSDMAAWCLRPLSALSASPHVGSTGASWGRPMVDPADGSSAATSAATAVAQNYMISVGLGSHLVTSTPTTVLGMTAIQVDINYRFLGLTGFGALVVPQTIHARSIFRWQ